MPNKDYVMLRYTRMLRYVTLRYVNMGERERQRNLTKLLTAGR